jgi:hypothetical protein
MGLFLTCGCRSDQRFWQGLAVSCLLPGLNKQLDVHSYVLELLHGLRGPVRLKSTWAELRW